MTFRPGPLRAAAALAVGFIAVRVLYRALFHGADGDGQVLVALPSWRLAAPFAHVEVLGAVTLDGVADAAASALPIAMTLLAVGVANAFIDVPRLLARSARRGPLRGLARALSIAWATLPALADAVRAARFAQRLRGDRGGFRLLAPVLERTLERATAVAAALELRGYAGRDGRGACERPVDVEAATLGFGDTAVVTVDRFRARPGTLTLLTGPTGSGKTTLLRALSGLHAHVDGGWVSGHIDVVGCDRAATAPRDTARVVGAVLQNPRDGFATERVRDEIGLALELRGVAPVLVAARVDEVAERVGVSSLLGRPLRELSAGQAALVAIAAAVVEQPILLVVDEPLADLDAESRARIVRLLDTLAHDAGVCVVVAEHRAAELAPVADAIVRIGASTARDTESSGRTVPSARPFAGAPGDAPALVAADLTVRHGRRVAVAAASLRLSHGEVVALVGPNGAGKSSLLTALALGVDGVRSAGPVALVPDASDDLFARDTVAAECRRADRTAKRRDGRSSSRDGETATRFLRLLSLDPDTDAAAMLLRRHPRDLSVGQRRCLAIALQTARRPAVLLIDEPTRGLDPASRALVAAAVRRQAADEVAVLFATHDAEFVEQLADRTLEMTTGVVRVASTAGAMAPVAGGTAPAAGGTSAGAESATGSGSAGAPESEFELVSAGSESVDGIRVRAALADPTPAARTHSERADGRLAGVHRGPRVPPARAIRSWRSVALAVANLIAAAAFLWPLVAAAVPAHAQAAVPFIALALAPLAVLLVLAALDETVRSAHTLAMLATLAAIGAAIRIVGTGVGGVEALFVLLIVAGRAYGARFGLLLGAASLALSALVWGGVGPWLPFQMFACGWVAAGAGLLPRRVPARAEIALLAVYGVLASYVFGLIMNLWFWPFAVGSGTGISYVPGAPLGENLASFLLYSLLTSTAGWDTLRAITTVVGLALVGGAVLAALRRATPAVRPGPPPVHPPARTGAVAGVRSL